MEITVQQRNLIFERYAECIKKTQENIEQDPDEHVEIEAIIDKAKKRIDKGNFTDLIQYFLSVDGFEYVQNASQDSLNVMFQYQSSEIGKPTQHRLTINGQQNILEYCKTNQVTVFQQGDLIIKTMFKDPITIEDYGIKINFKTEKVVDKDTSIEIIGKIGALAKQFRYKKRFSFLSADKKFRYDLSIVKEAITKYHERPHTKLLASGIFQKEEQYEVEVEYLNPSNVGDWPTPDRFVEMLFTNMSPVLQVLEDVQHLLSDKRRSEVLEEYSNLCGIRFEPVFVGPMPVTLELRNLVQPTDEYQQWKTIIQDYTVTDKADGERQLLYFDKKGDGYTIDRNLTVKFVNIKNDSLKGTLLDGEFITKSRLGQPMKKFMCFDIYFHSNTNVCSLPLMSEQGDNRVKHMIQVCNLARTGDKQFHLEPKTFLSSTTTSTIFDAAKRILDSDQTRNYDIDGLVFTPKTLAVGAIFPGDPARLQVGKWPKVFKWKEINTIDFLIKTEKNEHGQDNAINEDGTWYKQVRLYVGCGITGKITPKKYITEYSKKTSKNEMYAERPFVPPGEYDNISYANIPLNKEYMMIPRTNEIVHDGNVVEFKWNSEGEGSWIPILVRKDKTKGNDYYAALNVWEAIRNQVTRAMITGEVPNMTVNIMKQLDGDTYYNREGGRNESASREMNDFHNRVKQSYVIDIFKNKVSFGSKIDSVFDIACGKMGDLLKFSRAGFKIVIGADKSVDNIVNARDGAYSRLLSILDENGRNAYESRTFKKNTYAFVPMDFSKVVDHNTIAEIEDSDTQELVNVLWGHNTVADLKQYQDIVKNKFHVVSCQFAIHYFFENKGIFEALLTNIDSLVKHGSYFVGTCLDGLVVDGEFRKHNKKKGENIKGVKHGMTIWSIQKDYEDSEFNLESPNNNFGTKISVYMQSINQKMTEYLVDFRLLEKEMRKHQFRRLNADECRDFHLPDSTGMFKDAYTSLKNKNIFRSVLTASEEQYSFMNRWFIFRKDTELPLQVSTVAQHIKVAPTPEKEPKQLPEKELPQPKPKRAYNRKVKKTDS